jgi:hypothetical protein
MTRNYKRLALLAPCFLLHISAKTQIVNIESARMQSDTTGWMGNASAALALTKNTEQVFSSEVDAHVQYKSRKSLYLLLGSYGFLKAAGTNLIDNSFFHFRYNYKLNSVVRWEVFTQVQKNAVTGISSRFLIGTGPRFKIFSNKLIRLYAASLLMYEREDETNSDIIQNNARSSSYVSFTITPNKQVEIISTSFFQPLLNNWNDYRILNQVSIRVKAAKKIALQVKWNYLNDSRPVTGVPSVNYSLSTGVNYEF